ncbi:Os06g0678950 [Oryza sativa Japonica Group]|uniref:Os06g0678950 protein n=1 Tax=Oryza sativa subsp. japonica TaxID=39947 RepID=A0A0N7KML2_ORYSJ|nr:Os06g0678950 [Oryza sativa Japonica Group]
MVELETAQVSELNCSKLARGGDLELRKDVTSPPMSDLSMEKSLSHFSYQKKKEAQRWICLILGEEREEKQIGKLEEKNRRAQSKQLLDSFLDG